MSLNIRRKATFSRSIVFNRDMFLNEWTSMHFVDLGLEPLPIRVIIWAAIDETKTSNYDPNSLLPTNFGILQRERLVVI